MSATWIALLSEEPVGCDLSSPTSDGRVVAVWLDAPHAPHLAARRIDPRLIGSDGERSCVSWVDLEEGRRPLFDDPAVVHARRQLLRDWPSGGASSLVTDGVHFAGSVVLSGVGEQLIDPFARIAPGVVFECTGVFVPLASPTGPAAERYSGAPWPFDRFPTTPLSPGAG